MRHEHLPPFPVRVWRGSSRALRYLLRRWGVWLIKGAATVVVFWYGLQLMKAACRAVATAYPGSLGVLMAVGVGTAITSCLGLLLWALETKEFTRASMMQTWGTWILLGLFFSHGQATRALPEGGANSWLELTFALLVLASALWWKHYGPDGIKSKVA
jgi:cation transport ATPase